MTSNVNFRYNGKAGLSNAGKDQVGLVAQDLQKVAPELVSTFTYEEEDDQLKVVKSEDYLMISESSISRQRAARNHRNTR